MPQSVVSGPIAEVAAELPERCDRCGAAGKLRIYLPSGGELTFCAHHANRYAQSITEQAIRTVAKV